MERLIKGNNSQEEELFEFWDSLRKKGSMRPEAAIKAAHEEFGIENRLLMIHMQRYTRCFGEPK